MRLNIKNFMNVSEQSIKFLSELKLFENIEIAGKKILVVHYPQKNGGIYKKHIKNPSATESRELFKEYDDDLFLFGHTHSWCVNEIDDKWYIMSKKL